MRLLRFHALPLPALALLAGVLLSARGAAAAPEQSFDVGFPLAAHQIVDLDGDGTAEIVLVGVAGEVRVWRRGKTTGDLVLPHPARSLMWIGDVGGGGKTVLAVLSPAGLTLYPIGKDGAFAATGVRCARRAGFRLRLGSPAFAPIFRDINADGRPDLILPGTGDRIPQDAEECQIWMNEGPRGEGAGPPEFRRVATVRSILRDDRTTGGRAISDRYESSFRIPGLKFRDVNGDGRQDLLVVDGDKRDFYLQKADGTLPAEPDTVLDLSIFRDTTPEGSIRPGQVLAGGGDAQLTITDLDGDGIPDYIIAHRRKIWVFKGSRTGPRFTKPAAILKVAEDVSALLVLPLDDDDRPDLLILRVMVPSIASIVSGLLGELEVEISATGYAGMKGDRTFSEKPKWKGSLTVVVPDVLKILRDPGALFAKFQSTARTFRRATFGDVNGDGVDDVGLLSEDETRVDLWHLKGEKRGEADAYGLGGLFFDKKGRSWDIQQVLDWLSDLARQQARRLTGGRDPDVTVSLRDPADYDLLGFSLKDVDGDGKAELVVVYRRADADRGGVVDIVRVS